MKFPLLGQEISFDNLLVIFVIDDCSRSTRGVVAVQTGMQYLIPGISKGGEKGVVGIFYPGLSLVVLDNDIHHRRFIEQLPIALFTRLKNIYPLFLQGIDQVRGERIGIS
jgi:hypothetical protein